jgi:putative peptidoglycan lipid II flippase
VGIARGAAIVAGLTMASRMLGLGRTLVFSQTVGSDCLGSAYVTASQVPNLVYELVLGGALTSAMVPVLARPASRAGADPAAKAEVSQITSALLTWSVIILVPLSVLIGVAAEPIASLLNPANAHASCVRSDVVATTTRMLQVFAPQVLLYGLSVVLFGMLQAFRRFTAPSLAPIISSLVVITSFLIFVPLGRGYQLAHLPGRAQLVLSVGATLGVAVLAVVAVVPSWRLRLSLRPVLRFPPGVARRVSGLAVVGIIDFIAIDISSVVQIAWANGRGDTGAVVIFNYAWMVFAALNAVLVVSITVSAFPALAATDGEAFDRTCAGSSRAVLLMSWLGTAVMAAIAVPAAHVLAKPGQATELIWGFAGYAPGLAALSIITHLSRALLAIGRLKAAAVGLASSWLATVVFDWVLVVAVPSRLVPFALALGTSAGLTVVAVPMVIATGRICGRPAVSGIGHASLAGLAAAVAGAAAGVAVTLALPVSHKLLDVVVALVAAGGAVLAFGAVAWWLDRGDLRGILGQLRRRLSRAGG